MAKEKQGMSFSHNTRIDKVRVKPNFCAKMQKNEVQKATTYLQFMVC